MILEGFEVENWTCIKKLKVSNLPSSGVIVLHGPNRRGKSSLVKALRSCLMDYPSTTKALNNYFPRGSAEKPTVTITFHQGGTSYRIKKHFGTSRSEFACRSSAGEWRVETTSASEAHDRVCELAGGHDSDKGLHQLLWLSQAEFRLPTSTQFDTKVQARLREILGVLQTPLDDRFLGLIKKRWNEWHGGQRKVGKQHPIKEGCRLAEDLGRLSEVQTQLEQSESKFRELEAQIRQASELEMLRFDLNRSLIEQTNELRRHEQERERSQARIAARRLAEERHENALKEHNAAIEEERRRIEVVGRLVEAEKDIIPAGRKVEDLTQVVEKSQRKLDQIRQTLLEKRKARQGTQQRIEQLAAKLRTIDQSDQLKVAHDDLDRAELITQAINEIQSFLNRFPAPDKKILEELKTNRQRILKLRADRDAASMTLRILAEPGAAEARIILDAEPSRLLPDVAAPQNFSVRHHAEIRIPGWGWVELGRGSGGGSLDQIERDLTEAEKFCETELNSYGIAFHHPDAFDQLFKRNAEHEAKSQELKARAQELKKFAPKGLDPLRKRVVQLETRLEEISAGSSEEASIASMDREDLEQQQADLNAEMSVLNDQMLSLEKEMEDGDADHDRSQANLVTAKERLAGLEATLKTRREELDRLRPEDLVSERVGQSRRSLEVCGESLRQSELTAEESTVVDRLAMSRDAVNAIEKQIRETDEKYNRIKGRLEASEGLHNQRAALGAQVDELSRLTKSQKLERDAVDRLYELFEECREKQLGTLMGPIHDRVLNWMRVLDLGDYKEVRFTDAFLPEKLVRRDGTAEIGIIEESTGAQEQIGMLVRVALGSLLTKFEEPAVAVLDDPLTHCDVGRLHRMRGILGRATEGDSKVVPPAGPLQILLLTCHPEWFRDDRATVIDLEDPEVMQRFEV